MPAVGTTPIYSWPLPDLPDSADGPADIGDLARAAETTVNNFVTKRVFYTATAVPFVPIGVSSLGGWLSAGGFVGNANGFTVPEAGIYTVYLAVLNLSVVVANPLTSIRLTVGQGGRGYFPVGSVVTSCSWTGALATGGQMNLQFDNRESSGLGTSLVLSAVKVSA